jgi:hypothetical protein
VLRGSVLLCAVFLSAPSLWQALADQTLGVDAALIRFLLAVPVSAVLLWLVRAAMHKRPTPAAPRGKAADTERPSSL